MGFFSVPRLPGWSFQQHIHGGVLSTIYQSCPRWTPSKDPSEIRSAVVNEFHEVNPVQRGTAG